MRPISQNLGAAFRGMFATAIAAAIFGIASGPCAAEPLAPPIFQVSASSGPVAGGYWKHASEQPGRIDFSISWTHENYDYTGTYPGGLFSNDYSMSGYAEAFGGEMPKIQFSLGMTGEGPANGNHSGQVQATGVSGRIDYLVAAVPTLGTPPPGAPGTIPIKIKANGTMSASAEGMASAYATGGFYLSWFRSSGDNGLIKSYWATADTTTQTSGDAYLTVNETVVLNASTQLWIAMVLNASCSTAIENGLPPNPDPYGSAQTSGYVDPIFTIDPTWEYADYYHLEYSPGIEQYVPEPATIALLTLGALALSFRRK